MSLVQITPESVKSMLAEINKQTDDAWELKSLLAGGMMGGAWSVRDGAKQAVLKLHDPSSSVPRNPDIHTVVIYIREHGYPTPKWLSNGVTESGYSYAIQEFIPGTRLSHLDVLAAKIIIDLVRLQRTLSPPTRLSWSSYMRDHVFEKHQSHDQLRVAGVAAEQALNDALSLAAPYEAMDLPDDEMVHGDLTVSNILIQNGRLTGVVDIDASGRGCAVYDVLCEALNGVIWDAEPRAIEYLHKFALETYGPGPVAIAAGTLVIEGLVWRLGASPKTFESAAQKSLEWMARLHLMIT